VSEEVVIGRECSSTEAEGIDRRHCGTAALVAVLAAGVSVAALPASSSDKQPRIRAIRPVADSYVTELDRVANFGLERALRVDAAPLMRSYLRFRTKYLDRDDVKQVNLLVFSRSAVRRGFRVRVVSSRWRERDITYENAPHLPPRFVASGPIRPRAWKAVDVTPLVVTPHDEVSFALTTIAQVGLELASRESGPTAPRLVVELGNEDKNRSRRELDLPAVPPER
jgi:hypothetical protein